MFDREDHSFQDAVREDFLTWALTAAFIEGSGLLPDRMREELVVWLYPLLPKEEGQAVKSAGKKKKGRQGGDQARKRRR